VGAEERGQVNFDLSDEQRLLQETIRGFLAKECPPAHARAVFEGPGHDPALWKGMQELGLGGLHLSDAFGGAGLGLVDLALAAEALGHGGAPGPFLGHALAGLAIDLAGSEEQRATWLPRLATGEALGTIALGEPGGIWQPEQWTLEPGERLTGTKTHAPCAGLADLIVVGLAGGGLGLVVRGAPGMAVAPIEGVDRARRLDAVVFQGTPCEILPRGESASGRVRDAGLVLLAADAFGAGTRLVEMSVDYAKTREQFGVTIGHFQALKHQLANMALAMEPARALYWYAAYAFDHLPEEAPRSAALAKAHLTERAMQVARDAVECHGGIGFTWECDVQLWFKRCMFDRALLGSPSVHRERAARLAGW
jgi:alkylation response protein AidB-like acyl-CoA dehydrogenase